MVMKSTPALIRKISVLFAGMLVVFGCSLSGLRPENSNSPPNNNQGANMNRGEPEPPAALNTSSEGYQKLREAFSKLKPPYRVTETETHTYTANNQENTQQSVVMTEFDGAGRIHLTVDGEEWRITVGKQHYGYSGGKWKRTDTPAKNPLSELDEWPVSIRDVQPGGQETLNGVACVVYKTLYERLVGYTRTRGTGKTWIGLTDGLPHQVDVEWKSETTKWRITYEYDVDIKIKEPVP
jgi:hypothetical protein